MLINAICILAYFSPTALIDRQAIASTLLSEAEHIEEHCDLREVKVRLQECSRTANPEHDLFLADAAHYLQTLSWDGPLLAANIPLRETSPSEWDAYQNLPLSSTEARIITKIISTMAEKNLVQLMFEKKDLERKGKRINPVHPMKFIGYVFSNPYLKHCMGIIKKSHFKWDNFIDGYSGRMKEENARNNLLPIVPGFCKTVGADPAAVTQFLKDQDWEGLVKSLL